MIPSERELIQYFGIATPRFGEKTDLLRYQSNPEYLLSGPTWKPFQESEASELLRNTLAGAVKKYADKVQKIGIMLSGGFDSSVLAYLLKDYGDKVICYVSEFPEFEGINEINFAVQMALQCKFQLKSVKVDYQLFKRLTDELVEHSKNPIPTWTSVTQLAISNQAKNDGCDLLISGLGSDELFGGFSQMGSVYEKYKSSSPADYWNSINTAIINNGNLFKGNISIFSYDELNVLFPDIFEESIIDNPIIEFYKKNHQQMPNLDVSPFMSLLERIQRIEKVLLPDFSISEMISGIPIIYPFLEDEVWYNFLKLPIELRWKFNHNTNLKYFYTGFDAIDKYILRFTFQDEIPPAIQKRKPMGYTTPFAWWITREDYLDEVRKTILDCPYFDMIKINKTFLHSFLSLSQYAPALDVQWKQPFKIWMLYSFAVWYNKCVK
ncbi:asparagine synthase [Fulvivirga sp. 29W222]|uniref:asparagine synthase (glutamine-hydrolyzing) n=1 Tax=Fulvivirga marina TaxID=2494733 RepID=A0A937KEU9_9BACT|nr:asparagine synthase C-terminal domain-containing protein [Fulvivirga marina]MBL6447575.1 asparagine synthase [Fulvivirga marina]